MLEFWQQIPLQINPIIFEIGSFAVRWYSISYLFVIFTIYFLLRWRIGNEKKYRTSQHFSKKNFLEDLFVYGLIGMFAGSRMGYLFFYDLESFFAHPFSSLVPIADGSFTGFYGLSFHGGLVGIVIAWLVFSKRKNLSFSSLADFAVPAIPLGYMWGRIGNFLNGELFGKATDNSIGMYFNDGTTNLLLRHPSQLYEALGEGLFLFIILWPLRNNKKFEGKLSGLYLLCYGLVRFFIEFFRQPDAHLGTILLGLTMGQLLCLGMMIVGVVILIPQKKFHAHSGN